MAPEHNELVSHYLRPWLHKKVHEGDLSRWPGHLYLNASGAFANPGLEQGRLMPTYLRTLEVLAAAAGSVHSRSVDSAARFDPCCFTANRSDG